MDGAMQDLSLPVSMGTTIMAASYDGGVVMGADSRTSTGSCVWPRPPAARPPTFATIVQAPLCCQKPKASHGTWQFPHHCLCAAALCAQTWPTA